MPPQRLLTLHQPFDLFCGDHIYGLALLRSKNNKLNDLIEKAVNIPRFKSALSAKTEQFPTDLKGIAPLNGPAFFGKFFLEDLPVKLRVDLTESIFYFPFGDSLTLQHKADLHFSPFDKLQLIHCKCVRIPLFVDEFFLYQGIEDLLDIAGGNFSGFEFLNYFTPASFLPAAEVHPVTQCFIEFHFGGSMGFCFVWDFSGL